MYKNLRFNKAFKGIHNPFKAIRNSGNFTSMHTLFAYVFKTTGHSLLILGIMLWLACPILGLPVLTIYAQSSLSNKIYKNKIARINIWIVILIIFTTTIFTTSTFPRDDTLNYINFFNYLQTQRSPLNLLILGTLHSEPGSYILPLFLFFGEQKDGLWFLLIQSFTQNLFFTLYSIFFFPEISLLVIFINVTSIQYFYQVFLMRQFYALIFIIPAVQSSKLWLKAFLIFLAYNTHSSARAISF